ncbi:MAG: type II toxin-antitoxin system PemK/MazF family toxin [Asticcacaulis sp.]
MPAPGDIVWCRFPETVGIPDPKPRPALVLAVSHKDHAVIVVYGTSQKTQALYPTEFALDPVDRNFAGGRLSLRTKFDMAHQVKLPFDSDWFAPATGLIPNLPLPKMGILHPSYVRAAREAAARRK